MMKIKAAGTELEFAGTAEAAKDLAEAEFPDVQEAIELVVRETHGNWKLEENLALARARPRRAVEMAWDILTAASLTQTGKKDLDEAALELYKEGSLSKQMTVVAARLSDLHRTLDNGYMAVDSDSATDFVDAAWRLAAAFWAALEPYSPPRSRPTTTGTVPEAR